MLTPDTTLGPYRVVAPIGAGGMGEVYRATDTRLSRDVAIKVLPAKVAADSDRLRRFEQEARATGMLNHPNILSIFDIGQHDSAPYVVSELLEGETLRERMSGSRLPVKRAIEYASQIANGLAAAHEKGIVHRDLKPENLFVTNDGRVKILDFGLARILAVTPESNASQIATTPAIASTDPGTVLGTVGYMSPEQVRGEPADARSDIFSFGTVLYEMLSGTQAFRRSSAVETMNAILKEEPQELDAAIEGLPSELARIVHHCIEKQPSARFQSARDIAFSLESMSGVRSGSASKVAIQPSKRMPAWLLPVAALLAVALLCGATYLATMRYASHPLPVYRRLTYSPGSIYEAHFSPDGQSAIYGATWQGQEGHEYSVNLATGDSHPIDLAAGMLALSSKGEAAIQLDPKFTRAFTSSGTLATQSIDTRATPRELLADVIAADYAPGTNDLAILRVVDGRDQIEFPRGKVLYRTEHALFSPRFSPDGKSIAFIETTLPNSDSGQVAVVGLDGKYAALTDVYATLRGLAWSAKGDEIWFSAAKSGSMRQLFAVAARGGRTRQIASIPMSMILCDIDRNGRVLFTFSGDERMSMHGMLPGDTRERDLSWLDWSLAKDLTPDGKVVLFDETGDAAGTSGAVLFVRNMDGSPALRLRDGATGTTIAPDGNSVLGLDRNGQILQIPIKAGDTKTLTNDGMRHTWAKFFPDMKRLVVTAIEKGHGARLYVIDPGGGKPRAISPEGVSAGASLSPDGKWVAAQDSHHVLTLFPTGGGQPVQAPNAQPNEICLAWSSDSRTMYVAPRGTAQVDTIDLATGKRTKWKTLTTRDVSAMRLSTGGTAWAGSEYQNPSTLFVADNLR